MAAEGWQHNVTSHISLVNFDISADKALGNAYIHEGKVCNVYSSVFTPALVANH